MSVCAAGEAGNPLRKQAAGGGSRRQGGALLLGLPSGRWERVHPATLPLHSQAPAGPRGTAHAPTGICSRRAATRAATPQPSRALTTLCHSFWGSNRARSCNATACAPLASPLSWAPPARCSPSSASKGKRSVAVEPGIIVRDSVNRGTRWARGIAATAAATGGALESTWGRGRRKRGRERGRGGGGGASLGPSAAPSMSRRQLRAGTCARPRARSWLAARAGICCVAACAHPCIRRSAPRLLPAAPTRPTPSAAGSCVACFRFLHSFFVGGWSGWWWGW